MIVRTDRTVPKTGDRRQARSLHLERALPMFEIGNNLRAARIRQKLELSQAEGDTRIRAKYLRALEDERFEVLPGPAYTKGFLRTYADYLGLDGQRFVEEYNARLAPEEEPEAPAQLGIRRRRRSHCLRQPRCRTDLRRNLGEEATILRWYAVRCFPAVSMT